MKVAVLGGTRFIGLRVSLQAYRLGHFVSVLHRGVHQADLPRGIEEVIVDRDDQDALSHALKNIKADVLIDTFAMSRAQTAQTIRSLAGNVAHVVVLSSQDVYAQFGRLNGHPVSIVEDVVSESSHLTVPFPFRGLAEHEGGYDYDKKNVEAEYKSAVHRVFEGVTVLRLPAVFGSGDRQRRFGAIVDSLDDGVRKFPCQNGAIWRWTQGHVENVAHAIMLAAERKLWGFELFNVGETTTPSMRERVDKTSSLMGVSVEWEQSEVIPDRYSIFGKMPNDFVVDTEKFRAQLGYKELWTEEACYADLIEWSRKSRSR